MYDKKVLILEAHSLAGGLNSFYRRKGFNFDVGLHALTNFAAKGERGAPLTKLLKQLRLPYEDFQLREQSHSKIVFPGTELSFTNEFEHFVETIRKEFPDQVDGFLALTERVREFNDVSLENEYLPARQVLKNFISNPKLLEMILCPLLIYGSAWEDDMDFSQFVIMFKALYLEGLARPEGGVRTIINLLMNRYKDLGGEIRFKARVKKIVTENDQVHSVILESGEELKTSKILSSAGHPETMAMVNENLATHIKTGNLSFCESIFVLDKKPVDFNQDATLIFYNNREDYHYRRPQDYFDDQSAVICFPNNYAADTQNEGWARATFIANYDLFAALNSENREMYLAKKDQVAQSSLKIIDQFLPQVEEHITFTDVFSPTTVTRYTSHFKGAVYGSTDKIRNGATPIKGLALCGTDQGFLGIIGSMLSGISMANLHVLME